MLTTPALSDYWRGMWMRHEQALARVIGAQLGKRDGDPWCSAMAHFVLEAFVLSVRATDTTPTVDIRADPVSLVDEIRSYCGPSSLGSPRRSFMKSTKARTFGESSRLLANTMFTSTGGIAQSGNSGTSCPQANAG